MSGPGGLDPELERRLTAARERVADAERELDTALARLEFADRAEKTLISSTLRTALQSVVSARALLDELTGRDR